MSLMKSYDAERAAVQPGTVKNARLALLGTWKPLCDLINGLAIVTPSNELENLIAEMNTNIQSKKNALKQRKSAKKSAKEAAQDVVDEDFLGCAAIGGVRDVRVARLDMPPIRLAPRAYACGIRRAIHTLHRQCIRIHTLDRTANPHPDIQIVKDIHDAALVCKRGFLQDR